MMPHLSRAGFGKLEAIRADPTLCFFARTKPTVSAAASAAATTATTDEKAAKTGRGGDDDGDDEEDGDEGCGRKKQ
jgi:hypothetical protein